MILEPTYKKLSLANLSDLYVFYKKSLTIDEHKLFMPHPDIKILCILMYYLMSLSQCFGRSCYYLVYQGSAEKALGFVFLRKIKRYDAELGVAVGHAHQGKGYGKALMEFIVHKGKARGLKQIYLTVDQGNITASNLYMKVGFKNIGTVRKKMLDGHVRIEDKFILDLRDV